MEKMYAVVVLEYSEERGFETTHFGEMPNYKAAKEMAIRRSQNEGLIMGVDCYRETEMTGYEEIWLEVYYNGEKLDRINY